MIVYPDASVMIAATVQEAMTEAALSLLMEAQELFASTWLLTEVASGLGVKQRRGEIAAPARRNSLAACDRLIADSARLLAVTDSHCRRATELIGQSDLRAGDALHLAITEQHRATVWTLDRGMAKAGQALGQDVRLLA